MDSCIAILLPIIILFWIICPSSATGDFKCQPGEVSATVTLHGDTLSLMCRKPSNDCFLKLDKKHQCRTDISRCGADEWLDGLKRVKPKQYGLRCCSNRNIQLLRKLNVTLKSGGIVHAENSPDIDVQEIITNVFRAKNKRDFVVELSKLKCRVPPPPPNHVGPDPNSFGRGGGIFREDIQGANGLVVPIAGAACFHGSSTVRIHDGRKLRLDELKEGDQVLAMSNAGILAYHAVRFFIHKEPNRTANFVHIETDFGDEILMTPRHLIFTVDCFREKSDILQSFQIYDNVQLAKELKVGDCVLTYESSSTEINGSLQDQTAVEIRRIRRISNSSLVGVYSPLTTVGTLVVDDIVASCYSESKLLRIQQTALFLLKRFERFMKRFHQWLWPTDTVNRPDDVPCSPVLNFILWALDVYLPFSYNN